MEMYTEVLPLCAAAGDALRKKADFVVRAATSSEAAFFGALIG